MTLHEILLRVQRLVGDIGCDHIDITDGRDQYRIAPDKRQKLGFALMSRRLRIGDDLNRWEPCFHAWSSDQVLATTWEIVDERPQVTDHAYLSPGDTPYATATERTYTGCFHCGRPRSAHAR